MHTCIHSFTSNKSAPHTMTAKDKCSTKNSTEQKQSNKEQRKGNFSHWDKFIRWSIGIRNLFKEKFEILTVTTKGETTQEGGWVTQISAQCATLFTLISNFRGQRLCSYQSIFRTFRWEKSLKWLQRK